MLLEGVRVIDLSRLLPGAYCTQLLQQQGAEVIVIDSPAGEPLRGMPGAATMLDVLYAGKQRVTLNLRTAEGRDALLTYCGNADVLLEGFRPGRMERLQLGYDVLQQRNPRLVYCAITGYGSGQLAARAGHDLNYLARSGALSVMPQADGLPMIPGIQVADLAGGLYAAFLISAALAGRSRTGAGCRLEVSMTELIKTWTVLPRAARHAGLPYLGLSGEFPCYRVYRVSDGSITVGALETKFWHNLCDALGRADLVPRQFDPTAIPELASIFQSRSRSDWANRFAGLDVCVEPMLTLEETEVQNPDRDPPPKGGRETIDSPDAADRSE
jgi:crotonobetainyl-CoA:carnitine CoA-transferase CaiB-like acyl-CoA transferase